MPQTGVVKIGDFGIAKSLANTSAMARTSVGTPYFMSPGTREQRTPGACLSPSSALCDACVAELCRGEAYGQKSDMWSIGCIVYELVTLRRPFEQVRATRLLLTLEHTSFPPLRIRLPFRLCSTQSARRSPIPCPPTLTRLYSAYATGCCRKTRNTDPRLGSRLPHANATTTASALGLMTPVCPQACPVRACARAY